MKLITQKPLKLKILYVSPERFVLNDFKRMLSSLNDQKLISFVAIDEAHCISKYKYILYKNNNILIII